jgi:alanine racemase
MASCEYPHPSWIEINLHQFKKNIHTIKKFIGESWLCLPIKANAYGHGLLSIGKAAEEAGVNYLGVAHLQEGIQLRQGNIAIPILVLGAIHEDQIQDLIRFNLEFTISSKYKAGLVAQECHKIGARCLVHLEVDTGMQRTGVRAATAPDLLRHLKDLGCFDVVGVYSHLAKATCPGEPTTLKQILQFKSLMEQPVFQEKKMVYHLANSGGVVYFPEAHLDMVRPSLLAFGYLSDNLPEALKAIAPCFSLKSKVSYFKVVESGEGISYGHSYVTSQRTRIVTIPIGYGDGYRRALSNKGCVLIRGKRFPIVGTICMDQFMVDVGHEEVYVGDEVVLIGKQGEEEITVEEIAYLCDTIPYEVLCFFNERIPRLYKIF